MDEPTTDQVIEDDLWEQYENFMDDLWEQYENFMFEAEEALNRPQSPQVAQVRVNMAFNKLREIELRRHG